jgi:hypothetical protein
MGAVAFVGIAKLAVDFRVSFCGGKCQCEETRLDQRKVGDVSRVQWNIMD